MLGFKRLRGTVYPQNSKPRCLLRLERGTNYLSLGRKIRSPDAILTYLVNCEGRVWSQSYLSRDMVHANPNILSLVDHELEASLTADADLHFYPKDRPFEH